MNQLFQFDGKLYEQIDGVAMGSPLGPLMANAFLCSIEEKSYEFTNARFNFRRLSRGMLKYPKLALE